jgi:pyruvate formate-lyase activating enzyme-like uncharacterized protein
VSDKILHPHASKEILERARFQRNSFYEHCSGHSPIKFVSGNRSKPYLNTLSPGCKTCVEGKWLCVYISTRCVQGCFYCPQPRKANDSDLPMTSEKLSFGSVDDYLAYLVNFDFEGIGFSGGEPFLAYEKLVEYIANTRRVFGLRHYLWAYTSGRHVTPENLAILGRAGLDELRFDIAANGYDLTAVALAMKEIGRVSIEIPVIPEDKQIVMEKLACFEELGVSHLNLHQLCMTEANSEALSRRGYTIAHTDYFPNHFPVLESELAAFEIMKYASAKVFKMGINYCSRLYKFIFQLNGARRRAASVSRSKLESVTATGYLRRMSIQCTPGEFDKYRAILMQEPVSEYSVKEDGEKYDIAFSIDCLGKLITNDLFPEISVTYWEAVLMTKEDDRLEEKQTLTYGSRSFRLGKRKVIQRELMNDTAIIMFHKLFIENRSAEETAVEISSMLDIPCAYREQILTDITDFYRQFERLEFAQTNLPDYG